MANTTIDTLYYEAQLFAIIDKEVDSIEVAVLATDCGYGFINGQQIKFVVRKPVFDKEDRMQMIVSYKGKKYPVLERSSAIGCKGWAVIALDVPVKEKKPVLDYNF